MNATQAVDQARYQRRWLYAYWVAAGMNVLFLLLALKGDDVPPSAYFAVLSGALTTSAGAAMATHLTRLSVTDQDFDEATATMRVIVVGWLILCLVLVITVAVATDFGARATVGPRSLAAVQGMVDQVAVQLFGVAALFVVIGDGYTRYRRLVADHTPDRR